VNAESPHIDDVFSATFLEEDPFHFIKPQEYETFGISPSDIPLGTLPALRHPSSQIPSRWGGSGYGCGFFEMCHLLSPGELKFLQGISFDKPEDIQKQYQQLNELYARIGLLIRFSRYGKRYYLIPVHLVSNTLTHLRAKVEEISKIVSFHKKKYMKEDLVIGALTQKDDLITQDLAIRFREHRFMAIESLKDLDKFRGVLDLVILTSDPFEIVAMEKFGHGGSQRLSKKKAEQYATYLMWKLYGVIKPGGEIYVIANHHLPKTSETATIKFNTEHEEKNFLLFSHLFKTQIPYRSAREALQVNIFDFQHYLRGRYIEQEVIAGLLKGRDLEQLKLEEFDDLPHRNFPLDNPAVAGDQGSGWNRIFQVYFSKIFLKPFIFEPVRKDWDNRFTAKGFSPRYMLTYLGQKRTPRKTASEIKRDLTDSGLSGCPIEFVAEYRDSFDYVIRTLRVIERLRKGDSSGIPELFFDRLTEPLENRKRRFHALNDVIKLSSKISQLERIDQLLNPDRIEGARSSIIDRMEALGLFGFTQGELRELLLIVLGHSRLGRIISGKMTEKDLKGLSDLAATYSPQQALNLLRYCRLLTMAELEASKGSWISREQLSELFKLHDSAVKVVINRDLDWNTLLDEEIASLGGTRQKVIRQLLKLICHYEFLDNWHDLRYRGSMEKQALAEFDSQKLSRLENSIRLVATIEQFEERFLKAAPLRVPVFYRKILNTEFHGTGHIFERMDSNLVFVLLWITVNVSRGDVINFNPLVTEIMPSSLEDRVKEIEHEARGINLDHLDIGTLNQLSNQLYTFGKSFIVGTGFKLVINQHNRALEISHTDIAKGIRDLEPLVSGISALSVAKIPQERLARLESLFSELDDFYQSHLRLLSQSETIPSLPSKQIKWFQKISSLRNQIMSGILKNMFLPDHPHDDIRVLYDKAPSLMGFIFPELAELEDYTDKAAQASMGRHLNYTLESIRKLQALVQHKRDSFQDVHLLHQVAHKEFGPLATGIVGVSAEQLAELERIVERLRSNRTLFEAVIKSLAFRELGRVPSLRVTHGKELNPADLGQAGAFIIEKEKIAERYLTDDEAKKCMLFLVTHHGLLTHIVRGEYSFSSMAQVLAVKDKDLFDALFLQTFVILSAVREELFLEDMAGMLFYMRNLCHNIIDQKTTLDSEMIRVYKKRGRLFNALETYRETGLPEGISSVEKVNSQQAFTLDEVSELRSGTMVFALERLLRLQGIRYVRFADLADSFLNVSHKSIYMKRSFANIGMPTFEREMYEVKSIYQSLQSLDEPVRHFLLEQLTEDRVRVIGFEKICGFLTFENRIKLLLLALMGARQEAGGDIGVYLDFTGIADKIERRFEAVNDVLNSTGSEDLWKNRSKVRRAFTSSSGILFNYNYPQNVLSIDFQDHLAIQKKLSHIQSIEEVDQLKSYFHSSLQALRKYPFNTDDYELTLEKSYEKRLAEITDIMIDRARRQMDLVTDFQELHGLFIALLDRSWELGFSEDQTHRLNDMYQLRKDTIKRQKLSEVDKVLSGISTIQELNDYWESMIWYLRNNSPYCGKELDILIARRFDDTKKRLEKTP